MKIAPTAHATGLVVIKANINRNFTHNTFSAISLSSDKTFLATDPEGQKAAHTSAITTSQGAVDRYIISTIVVRDLRARSVMRGSDTQYLASLATSMRKAWVDRITLHRKSP